MNLTATICPSPFNASNCGDFCRLEQSPNWWPLWLACLPIATVFGNSLVVAAVTSDRSLKTPTNYLLVSLATADLVVGVIVQPTSIYLLMNHLVWCLPRYFCKLFIMADVAASTASITNLVAISFDRFLAVVCHIHYRSVNHSRRIHLTIAFVWVFSVGLALPLSLGSTDAAETTCGISNVDYILFGSIFAFFLPCVAMVLVNAVVCHRLHSRMRAVRLQEMTAEQIVTFGSNLNRVVTTAHGEAADLRANLAHWALPFLQTLEEHREAEETGETEGDDVSTNDIRELTSILHSLERVTQAGERPNRLNFEGIAEESREELAEANLSQRGSVASPDSLMDNLSPPVHPHSDRRRSSAARRLSQIQMRLPLRKKNSIQTAGDRLKTMKGRAVRLLMRIRHKEGQAVRKESRATKLVATVLVVFLVCWTPFFALNMLKVFGGTWNDRLEVIFNLCTWLGYINSSLNPVIYAVLNRKFSAKFRQLLCPVRTQKYNQRAKGPATRIVIS